MPGKPRDKPSGKHPFDRVCATAGIEHRLTRPFRPQTNGVVERFNRRIAEAIGREKKRGIAHRLFASHDDRDAFLTRFVHDYNHTRPKCLGYQAPKQFLDNLTGPNTSRG
jgi:transposase InsO family protein